MRPTANHAGSGGDRCDGREPPETVVPARATSCTARVAELADAQDLGSCGETRGGSTPPSRIRRPARETCVWIGPPPSSPEHQRTVPPADRAPVEPRLEGFRYR